MLEMTAELVAVLPPCYVGKFRRDLIMYYYEAGVELNISTELVRELHRNVIPFKFCPQKNSAKVNLQNFTSKSFPANIVTS